MPDDLAKLAIPADAGTAPRYALAVAVALLLLVSAVLATNVLVNPRSEFSTALFTPLVADYGLEKLRRYEAGSPPSLVVLGSSRGMVLDPDLLPGNLQGRPFNFAIPGAHASDYELLGPFLLAIQPPPATVVFALDDFTVSQVVAPILSHSSAYGQYGGERAWQETAGLAFGTLSADYLRDSATVLKNTFVTGYPTRSWFIEADGRGIQPAFEQQIASGTFDLDAKLRAHFDSTVVYRYSDQAVLNEDAVRQLNGLLRLLTDAGVETYVFIPPMHPYALQRLESNERYALLHRTTADLLLAHCGPTLHVFDFTLLASYGGTADGFYDNYHLRPSNGDAVARALADPAKDLCGGAGA